SSAVSISMKSVSLNDSEHSPTACSDSSNIDCAASMNSAWSWSARKVVRGSATGGDEGAQQLALDLLERRGERLPDLLRPLLGDRVDVHGHVAPHRVAPGTLEVDPRHAQQVLLEVALG